jgi:hypothetical protein
MLGTEVVAMAKLIAPCGCPSEGDEAGGITEHRAGCNFLEDLLARSAGMQDDPWCFIVASPAARREPSPSELALADAYRRHNGELEALDDAYDDDSWRTGWT